MLWYCSLAAGLPSSIPMALGFRFHAPYRQRAKTNQMASPTAEGLSRARTCLDHEGRRGGCSQLTKVSRVVRSRLSTILYRRRCNAPEPFGSLDKDGLGPQDTLGTNTSYDLPAAARTLLYFVILRLEGVCSAYESLMLWEATWS